MMDDQKIIDNAPDGATHVDRFGDYQKLNKDGESYQWTEMITGNFNWYSEKPIVSGLRLLSNIKELVELRNEKAELVARIAKAELAFAVVEGRNAELEKENILLKQVEEIFNASPDLTFDCCKRLFEQEFEAHNLEQQAKSLSDAHKVIVENKMLRSARDYIDFRAAEILEMAQALKAGN
jgi:hypothetical protein